MGSLRSRLRWCLGLLLLAAMCHAVQAQSGQMADNPLNVLRQGSDQKQATKITDFIFQAIGFGNTFMVTTRDGNVIIDTSMPFNAARHKQLLQAENNGPVKYVIVTHAHGDHIGGINTWKQADTRVIAQRKHADFRHYEARLNGFFALRNAAQFQLPLPTPTQWPGNYGAPILPDALFDEHYEFELGGVKFELLHTPGETPDHTTIWLPQSRVAFIGDNYYDSFPNVYTLRGTQPREALDYINSLNRILALKPEIVIPSHGMAIRGNAEITRVLTKYRDAIQYVHDETVKGMNAGKDVWTLMNEIKLPSSLDVGEGYGKLSWSVRGIYEGYVGWFDLNPATIYETPTSSVYADVVGLAGGPDAILKLANERLTKDKPVEALHLVDMALTADKSNRAALEVRLKALELLLAKCRNSNERGWLLSAVRDTRVKLGTKP